VDFYIAAIKMFKKPLQQVVVFGASGDLARRKIYPALHTLLSKDALPDTTKIVGYGRTQFEKDEFIEKVSSFIKTPIHPCFASHCDYVSGGYTSFQALQNWLDASLSDFKETNRLFYLSLPPSSYKNVVAMLPDLYSKNGWNRVILEKPFGYDLDTFIDLKEHVEKYIHKDNLFLIDHYLGKAAVEYMRNTGGIKGVANGVANGVAKELPKKIIVLFSEDLGVEGRQYFDESGIVRDIVQNHILQLIAVLLDPDNKLQVLKDLSRFTRENTKLGQYKNYPFAPSKTPTYVETICYWKGIPIVIRAGKALSDKFLDIHLEYEDVTKNQRINIQPHGAVTGHDESLLLDFVTKEDAYEIMIRDVFNNDHTRFVGMEEIRESWKIVADIIENNMPYFTYTKGELNIKYKDDDSEDE
jgi:glucose-6-phosphate 1-dehydrogenase